jgi:D-mannonate dehydratase
VIFIPPVPQIKAVWGFSSHPHDPPQKIEGEKLAFIVFTQHSLKGKRHLVDKPYRTFVGRTY